jgi:Flp pilus assembly protein TadG
LKALMRVISNTLSRSLRFARTRGLISRFARNGNAATAIEFALIAPAFFALIIAIFDLAMIFLAQSDLDTAVEISARQILTGQAQSQQNMNADTFRTQLCGQLRLQAFNCDGLIVDLETIASFSSANMTTPTFNAQNQPNTPPLFQLGSAGSIQLLRVMYFWPVFPGPLNLNFANISNGSRLLSTTAVFANEPS